MATSKPIPPKNVAPPPAPSEPPPAPSEDEWTTLPTLQRDERSEDEDALWITPDTGTTIQGELVRAFVQADEKSKKTFRASYVVRDEETGQLLAFSERAAFKDAIRKCFLGQVIRLTWLGKDIIGRGREVWRVEMAAKAPPKDRRPIEKALWASYNEAVKRGDATPF